MEEDVNVQMIAFMEEAEQETAMDNLVDECGGRRSAAGEIENLAAIKDEEPSAVRLRQSVKDGANTLETITDDKLGEIRPRRAVTNGKREVEVHENMITIEDEEPSAVGLRQSVKDGERKERVGAWPENASRGLIAGEIKGREGPPILAAGE